MLAVVEFVAVVLIVVTAALYAAWMLLPAARRTQLLIAMDRWAEDRQSLAKIRHRVLEPMLRRAIARRGGGCSDCEPRKPT